MAFLHIGIANHRIRLKTWKKVMFGKFRIYLLEGHKNYGGVRQDSALLATDTSMRTLSTMIHDGLREDEIYETMEGLKQHQWTHSITLGVAGDTITYGDVWMSVQKGLNELKRKDKNLRYAIWICKNIRPDGSEGRPHAHGVISTKLIQYQIDACFYTYGKKSYDCKRIEDESQLDGWFEYFLPQSVRDAVLTNISYEEYA